DRTEDTESIGGLDLMLEAVASERRMIGLDIDANFLLQAVALEEAVDRRGVEIVLVLGWLARLRLDEDGALEADLVLVLDNQVEEGAGLGELALHIGFEQVLIAFAAPPQQIIAPPQLRGVFQHFLPRRRGKEEDFGIGFGAPPRHEAAVGKEIG